MHHEIVALECIHQPLPESFHLDSPHTYTLTRYDRTDASQLAARLHNATIVIVTTVSIGAEVLAPDVTPALRLVAVMATGTDPVDVEACKKRGIRVTNCPAANLDSVSEHAISLYFAARRRTVLLDRATRQVPSEWMEKRTLTGKLRFSDGKPPLTCGDEVLGVVGYGGLGMCRVLRERGKAPWIANVGTSGKRIAALGRALGMHVLIAARKQQVTDDGVSGLLPLPNHGDRVPFEEVLRQSTFIVLSLPRNPQTLNLLSTPEFDIMSPYAVLVNIARGGIVDEAALLKALSDGRIAGYGTDVFEKEPAEGPDDSILLTNEAKDLNITMSPHLAWFSQRTMANLGQILKNTVEAWVHGTELNVIV
ncbi:hypothetical protein EJ04DRAFT_516474 [Polyplosphaeria fusca]|uniref:Glycerate dehydrogenase n=1 Tax=Polyplosphaeria fusca TaxID=682080 RepID=A0A9P4QLM1_9PLEO|nr:hypothetical protein EJ04DRAFT_516474 [Polyplosphaeria fusca]